MRKVLQQKNKANRRAKRSNSPGDWANFRRERNYYTEKIREAANMYRTKLASKLNEGVSSGPKSWWQIARQFMRKSKSNSIPAMQCGENVFVDNYTKAKGFNRSVFKFATIDTSEAHLPDVLYEINSRLSTINITVNETLDILKSLDTSKASGPDGISSRMLKETTISIALSFTRLLQMSLSSATFP